MKSNTKKLIVSLFAVAMFIPVMAGAFWETSDGQRTGIVYKFSHKGLIWKTWEGQLLLGNKDAAFNIDQNTWKFSLDASRKRGEDIDALVKTIEDAVESGK